VSVPIKPAKMCQTTRLVAARGAVAEAPAATLHRGVLGDGDDVGGNGVELLQLKLAKPLAGGEKKSKRTPRCLSRSLVSVSTSSWPASEKSRAETSGTY
jgi:hypothetical protein